MDYIDVEKDLIPETFYIDLADETFKFKFSYNETGDFFTIDLYLSDERGEDVEIIMGEKLTLNKPLWSDIGSILLPAPQLVPMDISGQETRITWENFGKTVFLYINDQADSDE